MTRFFPLAALALVVAACTDQSPAPTSSLRPTSASSADRGDPPPPPAVDDGSGFFTAEAEGFSADQGAASGPSAVAVCEASSPLSFKYSYLINKNSHNAFLHINPDNESKHVTIHQTNTKLDAHGVLSGPGFTFKILEALSGQIIDSEEHIPFAVTIGLRGILTTATESCTATGSLTAVLIPSEIE